MWRDPPLAPRRQVEALLPLGFFVVAAGLFPHRGKVRPGTPGAAADRTGRSWLRLAAAMLSVTQMFASDHQDGSLEQMLLAPQPLVGIVVGKVLAHWVSASLPLVIAAPLLGVSLT